MMNSIDWSNFNSGLLIEVTRPTGIFTCTGVAISKNTVLTAAHCLEGEILKVRVSNEAHYDANGFFWEMKSFEIHPEYSSQKSNYRFDIAKIKIEGELPSNTKIFPIIKKDSKFDGKIFRLGYGARHSQNARTLITPEFKALRTEEKTLELNDLYSYSGDSGGPIFLQEKAQMYLVALHSTLSFGPEGKYSFNPLLSSHREWLHA